MQQPKKITKPRPWFNKLPTTVRGAADAFCDIVTMLENYRPATLIVADAPKKSASRSRVENEIKNLEYELNLLKRAFGMEES